MNTRTLIVCLLCAGIVVSMALCNLYDRRRRREMFTVKGRPRGSWDIGRRG